MDERILASCAVAVMAGASALLIVELARSIREERLQNGRLIHADDYSFRPGLGDAFQRVGRPLAERDGLCDGSEDNGATGSTLRGMGNVLGDRTRGGPYASNRAPYSPAGNEEASVSTGLEPAPGAQADSPASGSGQFDYVTNTAVLVDGKIYATDVDREPSVGIVLEASAGSYTAKGQEGTQEKVAKSKTGRERKDGQA